ncbi:MAG: hypothetical protein ACU843_14450 [Gammaproteobacteria bacterium]
MNTRDVLAVAIVSFILLSGCTGSRSTVHDFGALEAGENIQNSNSKYHHDDGFQGDDSDFWYRY